jgi:hypothetical protein
MMATVEVWRSVEGMEAPFSKATFGCGPTSFHTLHTLHTLHSNK